MKAFHTVAVPHEDILAGRLTMDVFAADLWLVSRKKGPEEYRDSEVFFKKTYLTQGLQNLLGIAQKRLKGKGGDPFLQIQTPFGGGKTHSLIALYHKAVEWGAKLAVLVGTALGADTTLWAYMESQLNGRVEKLRGETSPGKEAIRDFLAPHQPLLILMDEVLEYSTKAAGRRVEDSNLAAQTTAFIQELSETVSTLERVCLVITLPSSLMERYDESAERLYQQLQKVAGRVERIYTPIEENEITSVIRRRLFSSIDEGATRETVGNFVDYVKMENLLPPGLEASQYRDRFLASYPFLPEVVDALYQRWGSFPTFQRTRGVLRLLALVIHSLKDTPKPYISLADFDLSNMEIRQELLKHIGSEYHSVIASDITDPQSGSAGVNASLGKAYQGLKLGTRASASIFMLSFSGAQERGASMGEIKRIATTVENPSSAVAEAVDQLKGNLFYLQSRANRLYFTNQPNLNRILYNRIENIDPEAVLSAERDLLKNTIAGGKLKVYLWETDPSNIPDASDLKLVILRSFDRGTIDSILKRKGQAPRVYRNTLFFLCPLESERAGFEANLKRKMAYEAIAEDSGLNLTDEQKREVKNALKRLEDETGESIRRLYRIVAIPGRDGIKEMDLGIPTYGASNRIDQEVYEKLRAEGEILEALAPLVIKEKYLVGREFIKTEQLLSSGLTTPGEPRPVGRGVLERGIAEGVAKGLFGLGDLEGERPVCRYFREAVGPVSLCGSEVLIREPKVEEREPLAAPVEPPLPGEPAPPAPQKAPETPQVAGEVKDRVRLRFKLPKGKVAGLLGVMNFLQSRFDSLEVELSASEGQVSDQDYEDKIKESFRQMGVEPEE